ncbi:hypothetical protein [Acrocarpospora catenulata]|uniref:hypothetical protein n=1 Tax=Acrocarpospora catenulata TaxID=2836182 RepID=UPI002023B27F|nr:hypothetical protein [Acrocarpospora catenulata]
MRTFAEDMSELAGSHMTQFVEPGDGLTPGMAWFAADMTLERQPGGLPACVDPYGETGRLLSRYAHAYASGDGEALRRCLSAARQPTLTAHAVNAGHSLIV